jgi:hypothetical protein
MVSSSPGAAGDGAVEDGAADGDVAADGVADGDPDGPPPQPVIATRATKKPSTAIALIAASLSPPPTLST